MSESVTAVQVENFTKRKIMGLLSQQKENTRTLAELRRGIGKEPGELPQLWGYLLDAMPEEFYGLNEPSRAEWAVYTALTLFALHQQGKAAEQKPMHKDGKSFGSAMAQMIQDKADRERIGRRFSTIATANRMEELAYHLRGAIQLMRADDISLDYAKLAGDIYCFQFPELKSRVRLKWGQDFYRRINEDAEEQENKEDEKNE